MSMNSEETPSEIFKQDYKMLELHDRADWKTARANYRRLVHQWHPDKYTQRPRERVHAQQQFIVLTKSYNSLRGFYRTHRRLPFEPAKRPAATTSKPSTQARPKSTRAQGNEGHGAKGSDSSIESGILGRDGVPTAEKRSISLVNSKPFWFFAAFAMMIATIAASLVLDLNAKKANIEIGKEVLRQAPPSDFMPSQAEIRKSQARGAFVQPTK